MCENKISQRAMKIFATTVEDCNAKLANINISFRKGLQKKNSNFERIKNFFRVDFF